MRRVGVLGFAAALALPVLAGCGGDGDEQPPAVVDDTPVDGGADECIDRDGDGFGRACENGPDCDDESADTTDECRRCVVPNKDCPCQPGTRPAKCIPPDVAGEGGKWVCSEGTRYCRESVDGFYYSDCEIIGQYVWVPD